MQIFPTERPMIAASIALTAVVVFVTFIPGHRVIAQDAAVQDAASKRDEGELDQELVKFFEHFRDTTHEESAAELVNQLNVERICEGAVEKADVEIPLLVRKNLPLMAKTQFQHWFELADDRWMRYELVYTKVSPDGTKAEALVRTWDQDYVSTRTFFDLEKGERWQITDWTDLTIGMSSQWMMAAILRDGFSTDQPKDFQHVTSIMVQSITAVAQQDFYQAASTLKELVGYDVPESMRSLRWCFTAACELQSDANYALEAVDKLEAYEPDAPIIELIRCNAYLALEQYDRVIDEGHRYMQRFGPDADAYHSIGLAYHELGKTDKAIECFLAGLDDTPESYDIVESLAIALPDDRKSEFIEYFKTLPDSDDQIEILADALEMGGDIAALDTLLEYAKEVPGGAPNRPYYESLVLQDREQYAEAMDRLIQGRGILDEDDYYREYYDLQIVSVAIDMGEPMKAYETIQDKQQVFESLLDHLDVQRSLGTEGNEHDESTQPKHEPSQYDAWIQSLIEHHTGKFPDDSLTWTVLGRREYYAENYKSAVRHLQKALDLHLKQADESLEQEDDYVLESLLSQLAECHAELNSLEEFFDGYPDKQTLRNIIAYSVDYESEQYQRVLEKYPDSPDDSDVDGGIESLYLAERYEDVLKACQEADEEDEYLYTMYEICSLAYLNRFDDAILRARGFDETQRDLGRAFVYAIKNDRDRFKAAFRRAFLHGYSVDFMKTYIAFPENWDFLDQLEEGLVRPFESYSELRRLVFLTRHPFEVNAVSVHQAANSIGIDLTTVRPEELADQTNEESYLCQFEKGAVVISHQGSEYFLKSGQGPYRGDPKNLFYTELSEGQANTIDQHQAWVSIDVYQWPQAPEIETPSSIPGETLQVLLNLAQALTLGDTTADDSTVGNAIAVVHEDSATYVAPLPDNFFESLKQSPKVDTLTTMFEEN